MTALDGTVSKNRFTIIRYALAVFLFWASMYLYVPTLPIYIREKVSNLSMVGMILSMYGLWQGIVRFPLGILADKTGQRKPFVIIGFVFSAAGAILMAKAHGGIGLLTGRAVTGLAAGSWVTFVVMFSALYPSSESMRASTIINTVNSAGMLAASIATGWLNNLGGYSLAFYAATSLAAAGTLMILPGKEAPIPAANTSLQDIRHLVLRREVLLSSLLGALAQYAVWATAFSFIPLLAKRLGAADVTQSMLLGMNIAIIMLGNLAATYLVRYFGASRLIAPSFVLMSAGIAIAALAHSLELVFVAQIGTGFALGINFPLLMGLSIKDVKEEQRSTAMGFFQAVYAAGMFCGAWLSGLLAEAFSIQGMFGITAALCLAAGLAGSRRLSKKAPN